MKTQDFRLMVEAERVESVVLYRSDSSDSWRIVVYGDRIPPRLQNVIETAKGEVREFADIGTAYRVIRASGWDGSITIDG
jgi:hypothetical protein